MKTFKKNKIDVTDKDYLVKSEIYRICKYSGCSKKELWLALNNAIESGFISDNQLDKVDFVRIYHNVPQKFINLRYHNRLLHQTDDGSGYFTMYRAEALSADKNWSMRKYNMSIKQESISLGV